MAFLFSDYSKFTFFDITENQYWPKESVDSILYRILKFRYIEGLISTFFKDIPTFFRYNNV